MMHDWYMYAFLIGVGATAFMDIIALGQKRFLGLHPLNYAMIGRWLGHLIRGRIVHRPITASQKIPFEGLIGWGAHYLIGILFAAVFLACAEPGWRETPDLGSALVFGVLSVLAPFLIMQPCLGAGLAARHTPRPSAARLKSLVAHLSFGVGLWLAGVFLPVLF